MIIFGYKCILWLILQSYRKCKSVVGRKKGISKSLLNKCYTYHSTCWQKQVALAICVEAVEKLSFLIRHEPEKICSATREYHTYSLLLEYSEGQ